ncbi:MAG: ATP-binding protein [Syntrophales bacterium]|nr:ATP-binding protein [Syntrophales bacterium]MDD5642170.1 ATP-binding protein [Syntrophales bacterium]
MLLRTKLLLAQVPLALALLVLGAIAITTIGQLGSSSERILKDNYRSVLAAQRMKEAIERMDSAALFIALGRRQEGQELAWRNRSLFEEELETQIKNITEKGEQEASQALLRRWRDYLASYERFVRETDYQVLRNRFFTELLPKFLAVKEGADQILSLNQDAMVRKSDEVRRFSRRLETFITFAAILAALAGIIVSMALTTMIIRPLSVLTQTARRIKEGDLEVRAKVEGSDEIALLAQEFNTMTDSLDRYRKSSLGELLQAQHSSQAAIDSLPDPVVATDLEGKILNANRTAEAWFGPVLSGPLGEAVRPLEPALTAAIKKARKYVLAGKGAYLPSDLEEAVKIVGPEGERYLLTQAAPVYDETGSLAGVSVVLRDVTLLSKLDAMSKSLVATFAHEFRTPLTSLRLAIHILLEQLAATMSERQLDLIYAAREDCERLQNLVDDILDIVRLQSGKLELYRVPIRIFSLMENICDQHRLLAEEQEIMISYSLPPFDEEVFADPERLELVFANLIVNAVRHTPPGGSIEIRARTNRESVRFEVKDTGEGIPEEYQAQVFDKYFQVPGNIRKGTGLGLAIAKNIIEAHGGEIGLESEPGQGSTFWFTLPKTEGQPGG